jgi:hypothetical protein
LAEELLRIETMNLT